MHKAIGQFRENLYRARELGGLAASLDKMVTELIDVSDIWRAQIVLGVSALDHLIHEMAHLGMIECAVGARVKTSAYQKFSLPLHAVDGALSGQSPDVWLGEIVREKHSWLSFQHPDKIADGIRLISDKKLWECVGAEMGQSALDVKNGLELVVDRRNKIAHEADMDPTNPGFRWPINGKLSSDALDYIERVAESIFKVVA